MCILFIAMNPSPPKGGYRLIIASNRDEYYKRPAKNLFKCPETDIIGGRDMEPGREGGMWLGASIKAPIVKFGALLNVTGATNGNQPTSGRGPIVYNYLKTPQSSLDYFQQLNNDAFSPFNLVTVEVSKDTCQAQHFSNTPLKTYNWEGAQIIALGNSNPEAPLTKITKGKEIFKEIVKNNENKDTLIAKLLDFLKSEERHLPDEELKRRAPQSYEFLSQLYVRIGSGGYGTRTHSIILVDEDNNVEFVEHTMKEPINSDDPKWNINVVQGKL